MTEILFLWCINYFERYIFLTKYFEKRARRSIPKFSNSCGAFFFHWFFSWICSWVIPFACGKLLVQNHVFQPYSILRQYYSFFGQLWCTYIYFFTHWWLAYELLSQCRLCITTSSMNQSVLPSLFQESWIFLF